MIDSPISQPLELLAQMEKHVSFSAAEYKWLICDVEWPVNHHGLVEVRERAVRANVTALMSNPSFEVWLIWHFEEFSRTITSAEAKKLLSQVSGSSATNFSLTDLEQGQPNAVTRARSSAERHTHNGTPFPDDNPSSHIYLFIEELHCLNE